MPDGMITKDCPQIELLYTVLNRALIDRNDNIVSRFAIIRNKILSYYINNYRDNFFKNSSEYSFFFI